MFSTAEPAESVVEREERAARWRVLVAGLAIVVVVSIGFAVIVAGLIQGASGLAS